jgi:hypothetical protein
VKRTTSSSSTYPSTFLATDSSISIPRFLLYTASSISAPAAFNWPTLAASIAEAQQAIS